MIELRLSSPGLWLPYLGAKARARARAMGELLFDLLSSFLQGIWRLCRSYEILLSRGKLEAS
jgi:hypothetical protein